MGERAGEVAAGAAGGHIATVEDSRLASVQGEIASLKADIQKAADKDAAALKKYQRSSQEMETARRAGEAANIARSEADAKAAFDRYNKAQAGKREAEAELAAATEERKRLGSSLTKKTREAWNCSRLNWGMPILGEGWTSKKLPRMNSVFTANWRRAPVCKRWDLNQSATRLIQIQ